jgi:hypothetical protein
MRDNFYVTLFSNGSQTLYPDNTLSAFTIELAHPINLRLSDKWEVGLSEFTCPPPKKPGTYQAFDLLATPSLLCIAI